MAMSQHIVSTLATGAVIEATASPHLKVQHQRGSDQLSIGSSRGDATQDGRDGLYTTPWSS